MSFADDLPDQDFVPTPDQRTWYREHRSGQRGFFLRVDGVDLIQLDRPAEVIRVPFVAGEWNVEREYRPLTVAQIAKACFEADREICRARGMHELARREWVGLTEEQRIAWMNHGPKNDEIRARLWSAMMGVLRGLAR